MLLGQLPAVAPTRAVAALAAQRQASTNARNAAIDKAEDAQTRNAILRGVLAARGSFAAGDYPQAALNAVSAAVPPIGRGLRVGAALNKGNVPDAIKAGLGFFPKTATPLALFDIGEKLVSGKPEQAALAAGRVVAVAAFGPVFVIGEGIFNFVRKQERERERYAPASLDEETRALYERFADVDSAESDRIMLAYADETRLIEQDNGRLVRAADAIEGSAVPGEFIGEGEPVPVNVLAAVPAISDTGEAGYTPIASLSPDGEIFYDEQFLPIIDEVIDAIADSAAAAEESGEYPAEGFLEGEWQLPVVSSLPVTKMALESAAWRELTFDDYIAFNTSPFSGIAFEDWTVYRAGSPPMSFEEFSRVYVVEKPTPGFCSMLIDRRSIPHAGSSVYVDTGEPRYRFASDDPMRVLRLGSECYPPVSEPAAPPGVYAPGDIRATEPYVPAGDPVDPFTQAGGQDGPSSPSSPYTGPYSAPSSPYTGPSSPGSPYSAGQTFPALPASSGGSIVPGTGDPVKSPFPWWIVIATVILS